MSTIHDNQTVCNFGYSVVSVKTQLPVMDWGGLDLIFQKAEEEACDASAGAAGLAGEHSLEHQDCMNEMAENISVAADSSTATSCGLHGTAPGKENSPLAAGSSLTKLTRQLRCKIYRQKKKIAKLEAQMQKKHNASLGEVLEFTEKTLPAAVFNFLKLQLKCAGRAPKGRR